MANCLFIRIFDIKKLSAADCLVEWQLRSVSGQLIERSDGIVLIDKLRAKLPTISENEIVVLLPGYNVTVSKVSISNQHSKYLKNAITFALEEQLAEPLEDVHIAIGSKGDRQENGEVVYDVAVVGDGVMQDVAKFLSLHGLRPRIVISETMLIPTNPDQAMVLFDTDSVLFAFAQDVLSRLELETFIIFLEGYLKEKENGNSLSADKSNVCFKVINTWVQDSATELSKSIFEKMVEICAGYNIEIRAHRLKEKSFSWLCEQYFTKADSIKPINLLQGNYWVKPKLKALLPHAKQVAAIFVIWFLFQILFNVGMLFYFRHKADSLNMESIAFYQKKFPAEVRVDDIKSQINQHIMLAKGSGLLGFFNELAKVKQETGIDVNSFTYDVKTGELKAEFSTITARELEKYTPSAQDKNFLIDIEMSKQEQASDTIGYVVIRRKKS